MVEQGGEFYDRQEVRDPEQRLAQMFTALPGLVRHAMDNAPGIAAHLAGVDASAVSSPEALAALPVLRQSSLAEAQQAAPPLGGLAATPLDRLARVFLSPGPIAQPESVRTDYWRFARALFAAGFRTGDLVHNGFSHHLTPAGMMIEGGARLLGCPVIPVGDAAAHRQLEVLKRLRPVGFTGRAPSLLHLLEAAAAENIDAGCLKRALLAVEATTEADVTTFADRGIEAFQCYATPDLGLVAYESVARDGLIVDEAVIVEVVRPGSGEAVAAGEVGEVLVTTFNPDYPLIRFATGDLSSFLSGTSSCGRTNRRIRGWLGRVDESAAVGGRVVHLHEVVAILERHHLARGRLVLETANGADHIRLMVEASAADGLDTALLESIREMTSLRGDVELVPTGSLPDDGKVIDDRRG